MTTNRLMGIGAFVMGGLVLFGIGLFMIGDRRSLFSRKFELYTEFSKLSGLEVGAPVWVSGMKAGEVSLIEVPAGPPSRFRVRLKIRRDLTRLVRTDSVASIQTEGLMGNTFLQVSIGSEDAPEAAPDSKIPSKDPMMFGELVQQVSDTIVTINDTIKSVQDDVQRTAKSIGESAQKAEILLTNVGKDVKAADFGQTLDNARKATADLSENMEALKHNFLLRGFFKSRGYFDLESISPLDYRRGVLLTKDRSRLREWVTAASLFRRGAKGPEELTPAGKTRLNATMGEWVQFGGEGPLMVEGYSMAGTRDQQFLISRARAAMVRTYLVDTFGLDPRGTGSIALGAEAPDASGGVFDGVALSLYVDKKMLAQAGQKPKVTVTR